MCTINSAFASAFTEIFIDSEEKANLNMAFKILNGEFASVRSSRTSIDRQSVGSDDKELAHIKWTKSAINLHNNQLGRKVRSHLCSQHNSCRPLIIVY